ncbi:MFS transporter [Thiohalorhabdus sp. Cl-TMA]|uniref:MFS transporter n=1 Tax=Thiohalorhabdus methylotrophus TaxID=3242694 RepID=A0ABV4U137_9GAMM
MPEADSSAQRRPEASADVEVPPWVLPAIVLGQVLATSVWFAANAVMPELQSRWGMEGGEGLVTTAVQLGFISGTLVFALLGVADRFHPANVFLGSALAAAASNLSVAGFPGMLEAVLAARFLTGFFLAGVYPLGMKIAAGWYRGGLGRALGFLVAALVLGTAAPHLVGALGGSWDWRMVLLVSSLAATAGGLLVWRVPEGPHTARGGPVRFGGVLRAFRHPGFRAAVLGYFGHMWELYAFWAFVPVWLAAHGLPGQAVGLASFGVIAAGALGCAGGGAVAARLGSGPVALGQLSVSGLCCLASPLLFGAPAGVLVAFLLVWGVTVAGDSPQFSALNARYAPRELVGSALTLANSIGFAVTIASLSLLAAARFLLPPALLLLPLAVGPLFGLWFGRRLWLREPDRG